MSFERVRLNVIVASFGVLALAGCGVPNNSGKPASPASAAISYTGQVHGGQQPISGASVYLYAASQTADAGAATSLLVSPGYVLSDANGSFAITGDYTCPAGSYVYLLAVGGNPGLAGNVSNAKVALAAGVGPCAGLSASTFVSINEVTTVATAYSLAAFAATETQIGFANALNMTNAFASVSTMVNIANGAALTATPSGNGIVQQAKIYSLANGLAACVNSDGMGSACTRLMSDTGAGSGSTPADTFQAMLNLAKNPTANASDIYNLAGPNVPFQPTLNSAPQDWTLPILFPVTVTVTTSPSNVSLPQSGSQLVNAAVSGASGVPFSYSWSTAGSAGAIQDAANSQAAATTATFCSSDGGVLYEPATATPLTNSAQDSVGVQVYSGAGCLPGNAIAASSSALVTVLPQTVTPAPGGFPTAPGTVASVQLPSQSTLSPTQVTVQNTLGSATPLASGIFSIPTYQTGPQIALVLSPSGNPMMMGWLDDTHRVVSPQSTAEVFAFYALGGQFMYTVADRQALEAAVLQSSGLSAFTQVVDSELSQNPDAFAASNTNLNNALNQYFTSVSGITPTAPHAIGKSHEVSAHPDASGGGAPTNGTGMLITPGTQSGVDINPSDASVNSANAVNAYRRRSHLFLQRVSNTDTTGNVTSDPADITDFELSPTTGLTGGVAGTVSDIFNYYWGNSTTAYAPVTSDDFPVSVTSGYAKSTYKVTVVGPGAFTSAYGALTNTQANTQAQVAIGGFVTDALIPFFSNFYFGSGIDSAGPLQNSSSIITANFQADWRKDLTADFLNALSSAPTLQQQIQTGDYAGATAAIIDNVRQSGTFRDIFIDSLEQAAAQSAGKSFASAAGSFALASFSKLLNAAGGALQIFDTAVYTTQLAQSDAADTWTIVNGSQKVTLSPVSTTLSQLGAGVQNLVANLPGAASGAQYSYLWHNTANAGDIAPADGSQSAAASFCSSYNTITYTVRSSPLLQMNVTDTVTVQAFQGPNCQLANALGKSPDANVTVTPDAVTLTPQSATVTQTITQTLTAAITGATGANFSYLWTLKGLTGSPVGTLLEVGGTGRSGLSFCSTSTQVLYVPNASPVLTDNATDGVTVQGFVGTGCNPNASLGTSSIAGITVDVSGLLITPHKVTIPQNSRTEFQATLSNAQANTTFSYQWTVDGSVGQLIQGGSTGLTFCSTSATVGYVPNAEPELSAPAGDTVHAQAFEGPTCDSSQALSGVLGVPVTVTSMPTTHNIPVRRLVGGILQASDGNFYGSSANYGDGNDTYVTNGNCQYSSQHATDCGVLYRISPDGTETALYTFPTGAAAGVYPGNMLEGPDGNLYGLTVDGKFFRMTLDGKVTVLNSVAAALSSITATQGVINTVYYAHFEFIPGSDGAFYSVDGNVFFRVDIQGNVAVLAKLPTKPCPADTCTGTFTPSFGNLLQASDGNFYSNVDMWQYGEAHLLRISPFGAITDLGQNVYPGYYSDYHYINMAEGQDHNLYTIGIDPSTGNPILARMGLGGGFSIAWKPSQLELPDWGIGVASDGNLYFPATLYEPGPYPGSGALGPNTQELVQVSTTGSAQTLYSVGGVFDIRKVPNVEVGIFLGRNDSIFQSNSGAIVGWNSVPSSGSTEGTIFEIDNHLPPPVQLTLSQPATGVNQPVTLTWNVLGAYSTTAQQCYAFVQGGQTGAGVWTGKQVGTVSGSGYGASTTITPTAPGAYTYALTCGGRQSGFTTLTVQ